jgi:hypothetical protein
MIPGQRGIDAFGPRHAPGALVRIDIGLIGQWPSLLRSQQGILAEPGHFLCAMGAVEGDQCGQVLWSGAAARGEVAVEAVLEFVLQYRGFVGGEFSLGRNADRIDDDGAEGAQRSQRILEVGVDLIQKPRVFAQHAHPDPMRLSARSASR